MRASRPTLIPEHRGRAGRGELWMFHSAKSRTTAANTLYYHCTVVLSVLATK